MMLPMSVSQLAETVATWAISLRSLTFLEIFCELGDDGFDGLHDAALERGRVGAGGHVAEAFLVDGLGEHGGGGGAVAGDVAGLGGDFPDELGAHVFVGVIRARFPWRR